MYMKQLDREEMGRESSSRSPQERALVGRSRELERIEEQIRALQDGTSRVLHVVGEAGIGKSRLLAELGKAGLGRGHLLLKGRATEFERNYPFGLFIDALDDHLASLGPGWRQGLEEAVVRELGPIFPSLAGCGGPGRVDVVADRFRAYEAVRSMLERMSVSRPVILGLDDLHWADPASIELLSHLLRRAPRGPVLLVLAYRPRQACSALRQALDAARRSDPDEGPWAAMNLESLPAEACRQLVGPDLDCGARELLIAESGGNPFYLQQLARTAGRVEIDRDGRASGACVPVPTAIISSITGELNLLSDDARTVVQAASVIGSVFEPAIVAEVAELSEAQVLDALDELDDLALVRADELSDEFVFRHPLVRRAVYEATRPGWRLGAHRRAARALSDQGASSFTLAEHVERAAHPGDEQAIAILTNAGHEAAPRAPESAANWFRAALRLMPHDAESIGRRAGLLVPLAVALTSLGRLRESNAALAEVLELLPPNETRLRARLLSFRATIGLLLDNRAESERLLLDAIAELPDTHSSDAARLKCALAVNCFFAVDFDGMRKWAELALSEARGDVAVKATSSSVLGLAEYGGGDLKEARRHARVAADAVDAMPDKVLVANAESMLFVGWIENCLGEVKSAEAHMDRALAVTRASGHVHMTSALLIVKSLALLTQGRVEEAGAEIGDAIDTAPLSAGCAFRSWALTSGCAIETARGDFAKAIRFGEQALEIGKAGDAPWSGMAPWHLAEAWLELGEVQRCRELVLAHGDDDVLTIPRFAARCHEILTRLSVELGDLEAARQSAERAAQDALGGGGGAQLAEGHRASAHYLLASGDPGGAAEAAQAAIDVAEAMGAPIDAAQARILYGRALAASGQRERALEQLERVERACRSHGARGYTEQAVRELRRLGRRVSRHRACEATGGRNGVGRSPQPGLTPRQLEVARLVTAGKTNRQIAEQLFLSVKGVESHLSRIFERLEVSSRAGVAAIVERSESAAAEIHHS
jgi:ATP/maltotriose-dependent transcriptional regulator MalT